MHRDDKYDPMRDSQPTRRERQVAELIARRGMTNKEVAAALGIAEQTVKVYVSSLLRRLNVENRTQLAIVWNERAAR